MERKVNDNDKDLESPTTAGPSKPLRVRKPHSFPTLEQRRQLEAEWAKNQNPSLAEREAIAKRTGRSLDQVNGWFTFQRHKAKRKTRGASQGHQHGSADDVEERIIFEAIAPALPKLRQLFEVDSDPSPRKVECWATALGNIDAGSIHKWFAWKKQDIALKSDCHGEFTSMPKSSVPSPNSYLPTPFSASPEPRRGSSLLTQMKIEHSPAIRSTSLDGTVHSGTLITDNPGEYSAKDTDQVMSPISPCAEPSNDAETEETRPPPPEHESELPPGFRLFSRVPQDAPHTPQSTPLLTGPPAPLQNTRDWASFRKFVHDRYPDGIPPAPSISSKEDQERPATDYYEAFDFLGRYSQAVTQRLFHAWKT